MPRQMVKRLVKLARGSQQVDKTPLVSKVLDSKARDRVARRIIRLIRAGHRAIRTVNKAVYWVPARALPRATQAKLVPVSQQAVSRTQTHSRATRQEPGKATRRAAC